jgi:predicted O-methyltransferase YrrM
MSNDTPIYPNWFESVARPNFEQHLKRFAGLPKLRFVQVGVFTGDASVWLLDNILTDPSSRLLDIDTWQGSDEAEHKAMDFENVYLTYLAKVKKYPNVSDMRADSGHTLSQMPGDLADFIYIDGDHTAAGVRVDSYHAHRILKPGGVLAFDDYLWGYGLDPEQTPQPAIDTFMEVHKDEYEVLDINWQVWLQKK